MSAALGSIVNEAAEVLRLAGLADARLEAEMLVSGVLRVSRTRLRFEPERMLDESEQASIRMAVARRSRREPMQYILGRTAFRTLELMVDGRVLIPRPETELLVDEVLAWAGRTGKWGSALDVGTGSGAIALSLAAEGRFSRIIATDTSGDALDVARANARHLGLEGSVELREGSMLEAAPAGVRFDVIVSNPPYVALEDAAGLMPEVRQWEPAVALFAEERGLRILHALIDQAEAWLTPGGLLALEIGYDQGPAVRDRAARGAYEEIRILRDLAGRERIILAERSSRVVRGTTG